MNAVQDICRAHGLLLADCLRRFAAKRIRLSQIHYLMADDGEEFLTCEGVGFHFEKVNGPNGGVAIRAVPGHFSESTAGKRWVDDPRNKILLVGDRFAH